MTQPTDAATSGPLRVLIVDDDPFLIDVLTEMLAQLGPHFGREIKVRTEADARRALMALNPSPHLLICDLSMPEMDGIEFMHAAALAGFAGNILLLSGMDSGIRMAAEHLGLAHGLKVIGTFKKPITKGQLAEAVSPLLNSQISGHDKSHNLTPLFGK